MNNLISLRAGEARVVADDPWVLMRESGAPMEGAQILPFNEWIERQRPAVLQGAEVSRDGLYLSPDDEPQTLQAHLDVIPLIAINFPSFRDGRGYSQAYLLRTRLGWRGELRAVGDVLRDQLSHMRQCGFDSFAIREDKSVQDALKGLAGMSVQYGRSAIEPRPLFRRRAESQT